MNTLLTIANQFFEMRYLGWSSLTTICHEQIRRLRGSGALAVMLCRRSVLQFRSLAEA